MPKEDAYLQKLESERKKIQNNLEEKLSQLEKIKEGPDTRNMEIRVKGTVHSGVTVQIGEAREDINKTLEGIRFQKMGDQITLEKIT